MITDGSLGIDNLFRTLLPLTITSKSRTLADWVHADPESKSLRKEFMAAINSHSPNLFFRWRCDLASRALLSESQAGKCCVKYVLIEHGRKTHFEEQMAFQQDMRYFIDTPFLCESGR